MITREQLRVLRNDLPISFTLQKLGSDAPYSKCAEGRFRFVCVSCGELQAAINPRNNLAHCFCCGKNINNIDLLLAAGHSFRNAVRILEEWLIIFNNSRKPDAKAATPQTADPIAKTQKRAELIGRILRDTFEKDAENST